MLVLVCIMSLMCIGVCINLCSIMCIYILINISMIVCMSVCKIIHIKNNRKKEYKMSEKTEKMKAMLDKMDGMNLAAAGESDRIRNSDSRRKKLLWFIHCIHILRLDGSISVNDSSEEAAVDELKRKLSRCTDSDTQRRETIMLSVINDHTHTWYIARHYYEKCSKLLCQMMITVMDFILEAETGRNVLYSEADKKAGVSLDRELELLSKAFRESYCYMCVYDYCTVRLAEFAEIGEYELLMPEHRRITANGLPAKLMKIADAYCTAKGVSDIIKDKAVKEPELLYDEKLLAKVYDREIQKYISTEYAMNNYQNMVSAVDMAYLEEMRAKRGE